MEDIVKKREQTLIEINLALKEREKEIVAQKIQLEQNEKELSVKELSIQEKDNLISVQCDMLARKDEIVAEKDASLEKVSAKLAQLEMNQLSSQASSSKSEDPVVVETVGSVG